MSSASRVPSSGGFSLIEMAVVLFITAMLLGSIFIPLQTQVESRNYDQTQRILEQAREALLGYAAANGRFPCPASTVSNGAEDFNVGGGGTPATGICDATVTGTNAYVGFLPATTIGFAPVDTQGYAVDAWGLTQNRIRYAVANQTINGITLPFTRTNGMRSATMSSIGSATNMLFVCNSGTGVNATNCNTAVPLASGVPVVIWSVGPNAATGGTSTDELENLDNDRIFVWKVKTEGTGSAFDDIVTWISPGMIFGRMIAAGLLP